MSSQEERIAADAEAYFRNQSRQASWVNDPVGWAKDVLGVHLWSKQQEISESLIQNKLDRRDQRHDRDASSLD